MMSSNCQSVSSFMRLKNKDSGKHGGMAQFIHAVVLIVGAEDLIEHLQQVLVILMDAG